MSNHPAPRPAASRPSTDRPTATYPTGWRACPSGYVAADDPRLQRADATPTASFPTNRSGRPQPRHEGARPSHRRPAAADAASLSHGGAGAHAVYHTAPSHPSSGTEKPVQDMGRPGILRRPSMAWHPSLVQLFVGAVIAIIAFTGIARSATRGMADAAAHCHELMATDWPAAERECGARYPGTEPPPAAQPDARTGTQPEWVAQDTRAPYAKDDPSASPLDLPRCTPSPTTPMPCLAHVSADSRHAVVLEEDASLTGLVRR